MGRHASTLALTLLFLLVPAALLAGHSANTTDGQAKDPAGEATANWKVRVLKVTREESFRAMTTPGSGGIPKNIYISPSEKDGILALVQIELEALSAETGRPTDRIQDHKKRLGEEASDYLLGKMPKTVDRLTAALHEPANVEKVPTRLFITTGAILEVNRKTVTPTWVDVQGEAYGLAVLEEGVLIKGGKFDPAKDPCIFYGKKDIMAAWVQPKRKITMTLVYSVPKEAKSASLRVYNLAPVEVGFEKEQK